jgi:hypothetical protein
MRVLWDGAATASKFPEEPWESEMSEAVAHLVSAFAAVERLRKLSHGGQLAAVLCELASQSICSALAALDECGITVLFGTGANASPSVPGWRESFMTVYSDLYIMT